MMGRRGDLFKDLLEYRVSAAAQAHTICSTLFEDSPPSAIRMAKPSKCTGDKVELDSSGSSEVWGIRMSLPRNVRLVLHLQCQSADDDF